MAQEPFLINPPKRLGRRRNALGETLTVVGGNPMDKNPWYGESRAHKIAALMRWGEFPPGPIPLRYRTKRARKKILSELRSRRRRKRKRRGVVISRRRKRFTPIVTDFIETGMGLGRRRVPIGRYSANPKKRRRVMARRRTRRNYWAGEPIRHSRAVKKGWRRRRRYARLYEELYGRPMRRRRRRRVTRRYYRRPRVYRRRRRRSYGLRYYRRPRRVYRRRRYYYRNPYHMNQFEVGMRGVYDIMEWAPYAVTGGLSIVSVGVLPGMVAPNLIVQPTFGAFWKLGIQLASVFGGGMLVDMMVNDKKHVDAWLVSGTGYIAYDLLKEWVFKPFFPAFAAQLAAYEPYYAEEQPFETVGGDTSYGISAYPEEVGAYPEEVGAYPYSGAYGY